LREGNNVTIKTWMRGAAGAVALALAAGTASAEVKVGVVLPASGPAATTGISLRDGMRLAVNEWNARGGVRVGTGQQSVTMIIEDSQSRPEVGVSGAQKLLGRDQVHFLIGEAFASSVSLAIMELSPQFRTPIMSGQSIATAISNKIRDDREKYRRFFKANFNSDVYAIALRDFTQVMRAQGRLPASGGSIAFVVEETDAGRSNVADVSRLLREQWWSVATVEVVPLNHTDFFPQLSKLRALNPDLVVTTFTSPQAGASFVRQWNEQGMRMLHAGIYYPLITEFARLAGRSTEGMVWLPKLFDPDRVALHREFAQRARTSLNREINTDVAYGYCYMMLALTVIDAAQSLDPDAIVAELQKVDMPCVMGRYRFDPSNNTAMVGADYLSAPIAQVQNGISHIIWPPALASSEYRAPGAR
jgi:ABC-type branched-subunit amino acid transport system substrate-binding protein